MKERKNNAPILQEIQAVFQGESVRRRNEAVQVSTNDQKHILRRIHSGSIIGCPAEYQEGGVIHAERIANHHGDSHAGVDSAVNVLAGSRTHHVPITERVAFCCDERSYTRMSEEQKPYPLCVFSFSISFTDKRGKREISHTAEMRTLEEHSVDDFMTYEK